ncbi:phytoene/squalene synthase family protein [Pseudobacteriovorax antillogorgiicola]|uniref:Phytoene synthase n=1 Tax=Pseudobacteriovorax antillogorgiicola TaxID=1513793 RepID=A0A1Y6BIX4_9BACT|nr:phytoene/squalene synthase family protein [Pseudobacteriovorax antillogorgiicola]TCS55481.1 phytoene synthase [Pseudobacteriovorax antillogorgiicola]SMF11915.1 phytoene synthase [Pseudobacteriovorax antillogorgiicola]
MSLDEDAYLNKEPKEIMAEHGKSFYWASHLFSKERFQDVALLYAFCRYVDDTADETHPSEAKGALEALKREFRAPHHKLLQRVHKCFRQLGIEYRFAEELISGAQFDVDKGEIESQKDLLVYCYKVAGVVGLMMCPVIGVKQEKANSFALDLGIGMQLTNICRDILEDAQNGRCYLPQEELRLRGIERQALAHQGQTPDALQALVSDYLDLADEYYSSGEQGYGFIPFRPRLAIMVAGKVYQAIGHKIRRQGFQVLQGRTYLNRWEKILVTFRSLLGVLRPTFWLKGRHQKALHHHLQGLPGVSA